MNHPRKSQFERIEDSKTKFSSVSDGLYGAWLSLYSEVEPLNQASLSGFDVKDELSRLRTARDRIDQVTQGLKELRNASEDALTVAEETIVEKAWVTSFVSVLEKWKADQANLIKFIDMTLGGLEGYHPLEDGYPNKLNVFVVGTQAALPLARRLSTTEFESNENVRSKLRRRILVSSIFLFIISVSWSVPFYVPMPSALFVVINIGFLIFTVSLGFRIKRAFSGLGFRSIASYGIAIAIWFVLSVLVRSALSPPLEAGNSQTLYW